MGDLPDRCDMVIPRGWAWTYDIEVTEDTAGEIPIDLSALTFAAQVRRKERGPLEALFTIDDSQANVGILVLSLTPAQTAALTRRDYVWDIFSLEDDDMLTRGAITMYGPSTAQAEVDP